MGKVKKDVVMMKTKQRAVIAVAVIVLLAAAVLGAKPAYNLYRDISFYHGERTAARDRMRSERNRYDAEGTDARGNAFQPRQQDDTGLSRYVNSTVQGGRPAAVSDGYSALSRQQSRAQHGEGHLPYARAQIGYCLRARGKTGE